MVRQNRYSMIIEKIFFSHYKKGLREVDFEREEIVKFAKELNIELPKNLGDVVYTFRYRAELPKSVQDAAGKGEIWIIRPAGKAKYRFALIDDNPILPNKKLAEIKVPDATPGIISKYALNDEQALLAKVRYNRLVDIFTGVTCYSLQSHLRTTVPDMGQVETDEIYIGINKNGTQYIFPVQAKGGTDKLNIVQIEQDFGISKHKFPELLCRPIAAQFMQHEVIALFEFEQSDKGVVITSEKHYKLVTPDDVTTEDLATYRLRTEK